MTSPHHRNFGHHNPEAPFDEDRRPPPETFWQSYWRVMGPSLRLAALLIAIILLIAVVLLLAAPARAHMHDRPDLDQWLMSLGSARSPCCDNKEAETLADPDWRSDRLDECKPSERASIDTDATFQAEYCVRLENPQAQEKGDWNWWTVPGSAVVREPNRAGPALIWLYWNAGHPYIRCFMPGAGG